MKRTFTMMHIGLMLAALAQTSGNKKFLLEVLKWEKVLMPTEAELERVGAVMKNGVLFGPSEGLKHRVKRELPLATLKAIQKAVDGCNTWRRRFAEEVIALSKKLAKMIRDEESVIAWDKLPEKEKKKRLKALEKEKNQDGT